MRDWNDPKYVAARLAVRKRDQFRCKKCGASKGYIQVHHIRPYHSNPSLLCEVGNMISLCKKCHNGMKGNEEAYIQLCTFLLRKNDVIDVKRMLYNLKKEEEEQDEL